MRNNLCKWLAAILCIAMVLTLMPASLAEQDKETESAVTTAAEEAKYAAAERNEEPVWDDGLKGDVYAEDMSLGVNTYAITAGNTVYRRFTFPTDDTYRFYSVSDYDTIGYIRNSSGVLTVTNDDNGYGRNFMMRVKGTAGLSIYIGASLYNTADSATVAVVAERMTRDNTPLALGFNNIVVSTAGDYVYRTFTPDVSGTYSVYSYVNADTFGCITTNDNPNMVLVWNDDGGESYNFSYDCTLEAGTSYDIGTRFYSGTATGTIPVIIERRAENSSTVALGRNDYEIQTAGTTLYRPFVPSATGNYRFLSTVRFGADMTAADTEGMLADSEMAVFEYDNDGGYAAGFSTSGNPTLTAGNTYYLGVRYRDKAQTGTLCVLAERPLFGGVPLSVGGNSVSINVAGTTAYRPFTPTESGRYEIRSTGDADTFGTFADDEYRVMFYDDDSGSDRNFRFTADMIAGKTYYIGVRYYQTAYTGSIPIVIEKQADTFSGTIEWNKNDLKFKGTTPYVIANGAAQTPRFTVKDENGAVVDPSEYTYEYRENVNAGTAYVIVSFKNTYAGTARAWFKIYLPATNRTAVENVENGIYIEWNAVPGAAGYVIYRRAWSSKTNGWTSFERWNNTTDLCWTDLNVYAGSRYQYGVKAYFKQRTDPVSGAVIGGNVGDNYNLGEVGPLKTTVRITTRRLNSLKAGSKQITVNWAGSSVFTGYEVQYATNAAFTQNVKNVKITKKQTYSTTIKSLKNGTEYFVRVRSYHVFEGMTYYGQWSNILSVKPGSGQTAHYGPNMALLIGEVEYHGTATDRACGLYDTVIMSGMLQGLYNRFEPTVKTNQNKADVVNAIRSAYTVTTDGSVSVFFFSGHGSGENYGAAGLYCCDGLTLSYKDLAAELNSSVKGRVIVILSCCHSGASINKSASEYDEDANLAAAIEAFSGYTLDTGSGTRSGELANSKFIVIAAAPSAEVSWSENHVGFDGSGYPQSALTASIVNGMGVRYPGGTYMGKGMPADTNGDGLITLKELYTYSYNAVYGWTENVSGEGYSGPQHVQYYGPDGEILFRRK